MISRESVMSVISVDRVNVYEENGRIGGERALPGCNHARRTFLRRPQFTSLRSFVSRVYVSAGHVRPLDSERITHR